MASIKYVFLATALLAGACVSANAGAEVRGESYEDMQASLRKLQAYAGCSADGISCTTDNGDGTSTVCVNTVNYKHCWTHANGENAGRKLKAQASFFKPVLRKLQGYDASTGCTTYPGGETCSKYDPSTKTVTSCPSGPGSCTTYNSADVAQAEGVLEGIGRRMLAAKDEAIRNRRLQQYNPSTGCTTYPGGVTCSKYNGDSNTVTDCPSGPGSCTTYTVGDAEAAAAEASGVLSSFGRKLLSDDDITMLRRLKAYSGCTSGDWGSTCTTDLGNGQSQVCTETPYSSNCSTYANGD